MITRIALASNDFAYYDSTINFYLIIIIIDTVLLSFGIRVEFVKEVLKRTRNGGKLYESNEGKTREGQKVLVIRVLKRSLERR